MTITLENWAVYAIVAGFIIVFACIFKAYEYIHAIIDKYSALEESQSNLTKNILSEIRSNHVIIEAINKTLESIEGYVSEKENPVINDKPEITLCADGDTDGDANVHIPHAPNIMMDQSKLSENQMEYHTTFANKLTNPEEWLEEENFEDEEDDFPDGVKIVGYRWIFPTKERDRHPLFGQWYKVIGTVRGKNMPNNEPMIWSDDAYWNGYQFRTRKGDRFDKVYAYIKLPDSGDVMESIVEIALEKE